MLMLLQQKVRLICAKYFRNSDVFIGMNFMVTPWLALSVVEYAQVVYFTRTSCSRD